MLSIITIIFATAAVILSSEKESFQFRKQPEIQQIKPKKPVKIELKRAADGRYSWEIKGDDVDEIVNTNRRLKKLLKID